MTPTEEDYARLTSYLRAHGYSAGDTKKVEKQVRELNEDAK